MDFCSCNYSSSCFLIINGGSSFFLSFKPASSTLVSTLLCMLCFIKLERVSMNWECSSFISVLRVAMRCTLRSALWLLAVIIKASAQRNTMKGQCFSTRGLSKNRPVSNVLRRLPVFSLGSVIFS